VRALTALNSAAVDSALNVIPGLWINICYFFMSFHNICSGQIQDAKRAVLALNVHNAEKVTDSSGIFGRDGPNRADGRFDAQK
jgi:hypothetical protein